MGVISIVPIVVYAIISINHMRFVGAMGAVRGGRYHGFCDVFVCSCSNVLYSA